MRPASKSSVRITTIDDSSDASRFDELATEEPLEIRLGAAGERRTLAVTMRTPGADFELAAGFLYGENVVADRLAIARISYCTDPDVDAEQQFNIVNVDLSASSLPSLKGLERHFYTSSACGVCGKATLDALELRGHHPVGAGPRIPREVVHSLPNRLRAAQGLFAATGGLHAAGLFDASGELLCIREDVGRHNAVDKIVGWALLQDQLPLSNHILMVSGRSSYEIMQKALAARIPIVCAVSAPSSLAVEVAARFGMTLIGFLRDKRFNVYAGAHRIEAPAELPTQARHWR